MSFTAPLTKPTLLLSRLASWKLWIASALIFVPFAWVFFRVVGALLGLRGRGRVRPGSARHALLHHC